MVCAGCEVHTEALIMTLHYIRSLKLFEMEENALSNQLNNIVHLKRCSVMHVTNLKLTAG